MSKGILMNIKDIQPSQLYINSQKLGNILKWFTPSDYEILVGAVAQLERDYLKDRQMEGITIAVIECRYKRRKPVGYPKLWKRYYKMMQDGDISGVDVMKNIRFKENYIL